MTGLVAADTGTADAGRREQNKNANRDAILRAAESVFLEQGYDAVTIRDVIRRTDLACGTFYNYFRDKETLFRTLLNQRVGAISERLHAARTGASTLEDFVLSAYRTVFADVHGDPTFFALIFRNEPVIRALFSDHVMGMLMGNLRQDLEDAIARGMLPPVDLEALTSLLFGAGFEMCRLLVGDPKRDPLALAEFAARIFLDGLRGLGGSSARSPEPPPG